MAKNTQRRNYHISASETDTAPLAADDMLDASEGHHSVGQYSDTQPLDDELRFRCNRSIEFDDDLLADILCILHPTSKAALDAVALIAEQHPECTLNTDLVEANTQLDEHSQKIKALEASNTVGIRASTAVAASAKGVEASMAETIDASAENIKPRDIVLRLSILPKDPIRGFSFGRADRNDFKLADPSQSISNRHFMIYVNEHGAIMLEDSSTNGTYVDTKHLRAADKENNPYRNTLEHGSVIKVLMNNVNHHVSFIVRIPRREDEVEERYEDNLTAYFIRLNAIKLQEERNKQANPSPPVLFPLATSVQSIPQSISSNPSKRIRPWKGGDKYNMVGVIGKGAFATVHKITQKSNGIPFAAKEIKKSRYVKNGKLDEKVSNELRIMRRIHHENIVKFIEHVDWEDNLYIIMEMVPGGDLSHMISVRGTLAEEGARDMSEQLLSALGYLHSRNITHRDIKPDNILLSSHEPIRVKLTDFGLSKMVDEDTFMRTFCGTLLYCAPEVYHEFDQYDEDGSYHPLRNHTRSNQRDPYSKACDLWSLAGVLFFALCGAPPFPVGDNCHYTELLRMIMNDPLDIRPLQTRNLSESCIRFLKDMLQKWPKYRPSVEKLQAHPWITGIPASQATTEDEDEVDLIRDPDTTELAQSTSQLSVRERFGSDGAHEYDSLEEIDRNNLQLSLQRSFEIPSSVNSGGSSAGESFAFMRNGPDRERLFGELGSSALGSSGAIPDRLNLPMSTFGNDQLHTHADNTFNSSESNIHPMLRNANGALTRLEYSDARSYQNAPSLLGTESVFGHLQVRSPPSAALSPQSEMPESPEAQSPEGDATNTTRPSQSFITAPSTSMRRQREPSGGANDEPIAKRQKSRADDFRIEKSYWWDPRDVTTWHDDYPEMTLGELRAREAEAAARSEVYRPPRTTATPNYSSTGRSKDCISPTPSMYHKGHSSSSTKANTSTKPDSFRKPNRILAKLLGEPGSALPSLAMKFSEQFSSWGRGSFNTHVYPDGQETRISKYAFKLILWNRSLNSDNLLEAPDSTFYIASKGSNGLTVNGTLVASHDKGNARSESKNWAQLKHGDLVTIFDAKIEEPEENITLRFECYFGASKQSRSPNEAVFFMPECQELKDLEETVLRKETEIFGQNSASSANNSNILPTQQQVDLGPQAITNQQPDKRAVASGSMSRPVITRSNRPVAKTRGGGPLARVRGESGVSTNLPIALDNRSHSSSSTGHSASSRRPS